MREARALVTERLDRIESSLNPGQGALDFFATSRGDLDSGIIGAGLGYEHRVTEELSAFANGLIGHGWGTYAPLSWEAMTGLRLRF